MQTLVEASQVTSRHLPYMLEQASAGYLQLLPELHSCQGVKTLASQRC